MASPEAYSFFLSLDISKLQYEDVIPWVQFWGITAVIAAFLDLALRGKNAFIGGILSGIGRHIDREFPF